MRKKLIKWSVVVCMVAALLLFLRWKLPAKQDVSLAETSLAATDDLVASYRDGQNSLMFRSRDISEQEVYHLLQAGEPYLSNLETETYQNGALRLTWNIPSRQEQDDGLEAARKLGAQAVQGQITITGKLQAIHDALIRGCVYTENGELRTQMAAGAVQDKKAVCAGYARAFQAMCDGAGLDVYYVEDDDMTHAWNAVRLYGTTYFIDCTYDDPVPDGGEKACQTYFMLTADEMKQTHTWNAELYEDYLDSRYPENFAYIQRMQDLQLADAGLAPVIVIKMHHLGRSPSSTRCWRQLLRTAKKKFPAASCTKKDIRRSARKWTEKNALNGSSTITPFQCLWRVKWAFRAKKCNFFVI